MTVSNRHRVSFEAGGAGEAGASSGRVSGLFHRPDRARALYVLAHGAGAGMEHPFMDAMAGALYSQGIATFRYQFPYMEAGRKRPDSPGVAQRTVRSAVAEAARLAPDLPLLAGGKSFGGRMTSSSAATETLEGVRGLVFLGFPLHAPGRNDDSRAAHLFDVDLPMLFLQGTRDSLASLDLMRPLCKRLGSRATLHVVEGGDHSFKVLKRSGRSADEVEDELCSSIVAWARGVTG